MSLRLEGERLQFKRLQGEGRARTVVEGSLELPAGRPPIGRGLRAWAKAVVQSVEPSDDRVLVEGVFHVSFLYAAQREDGDDEGRRPLGFSTDRVERVDWTAAVPFTYLLDVPGAREEGPAAEVTARAESCGFQVDAGQTGVHLDIVLELTARIEEDASAKVITAAHRAGAEADSVQLRIRQPHGRWAQDVDVEADLALGGREPAEKALLVEARPTVDEVVVSDGAAHVRGRIDWTALYMAAEDAGLQYMEWLGATKLDAQVQVGDLPRGVRLQAAVDVLAASARPVDLGAESGLRAAATLRLQVAADDLRHVPVVTAVRSEEAEIAQRTEPLAITEEVGEAEAGHELESVMELPADCPPIERILCGWGRIDVEDVHVLGGKVAIEGAAAVEMLYVARGEEDGAVCTARWNRAIPFDLELALPGAEPGMDRRVRAAVDRVEFDPINRETVEVRVAMRAGAKLTRTAELEALLEAVEVPPLEEDAPTFTFVVAEEGDTLWKLAQSARTTEEALRAANPGLEEGRTELLPGEKVCVPRRIGVKSAGPGSPENNGAGPREVE